MSAQKRSPHKTAKNYFDVISVMTSKCRVYSKVLTQVGLMYMGVMLSYPRLK